MTEDAELGVRLEAAVRAGGGSELTSVGEAIDRYVFNGAVFPSPCSKRCCQSFEGQNFAD
jgi:hypothetical protein